MSDATEHLEELVTQFIMGGLELGLIPPRGAVVTAISDGDQVIRITSNLTGFGTDPSGQSAVGVETTVRIQDYADHD